ncbi:MAG: PDZ domain-containing protein [Capsulimonadales bacterium]|nr:PDZ domain-containing protein [Capsulimonadales bacterium]
MKRNPALPLASTKDTFSDRLPTETIALRLFGVVFVLLLALPILAAPPEQVRYSVAVADIPGKRFRVTVTAAGVTDAKVAFALPAWSPGWYVITNADQNISGVTATDGANKPLAVSHPERRTWEVETGGAKQVSLTYDLLAVDRDPDAVGQGSLDPRKFGFFAPYLDETNGFVPGPASLMYVVGGTAAPCRVTYRVPAGWAIASANDPVEGDPTTFTAPNYDVLADHPGELGKFERTERTIGGVPVSVILVGAEGKETGRFVNACWKIAEAGLRVFGKAPFPRYLFHVRFQDRSATMEGLEHLNGTVVSLPRATLDPPDLSALSLIAHEYVHAWNVKRIRPAALGPFDYSKEVRVRDLWWLEGVTDYYAPRLLVEAGLVNAEYWRAYISEIMTGVQANPARKTVTLETASLKAWEGRSEGFGGLSYYEKGLLVGLLLDAEMRKRTENRVGLDDLVRALLEGTEKSGKGYADGEIERQATALTGTDFKSFFDRTIRSTEELDYDGILAGSGLQPEKTTIGLPEIGIETRTLTLTEEGIKVRDVTAGGPAAKAGLRPDDVITHVDGKPIADVTGSVLGTREPGDSLPVTVRRQNRTIRMSITLGRSETVVYRLTPTKNPTPVAAAIYRSMTGTR